MARIATLLGKDVKSGNWSSIGIAEGGADLVALTDQYKKLRTADNGIIKKGKSEVRFSDIRFLSTNTAGGELKAKLRFR